jgi:hypothetical protein
MLAGSVVVSLYLSLIYVILVFSLSFSHQHFNSKLQYLSIATLVFSVSVSTTILGLTILEFILWIAKLRK